MWTTRHDVGSGTWQLVMFNRALPLLWGEGATETGRLDMARREFRLAAVAREPRQGPRRQLHTESRAGDGTGEICEKRRISAENRWWAL